MILIALTCTLVATTIAQVHRHREHRRIELPVSARVVRVIDGDTFVARSGHRMLRVRVIGVDAPELHGVDGRPQCHADAARDYSARVLAGRLVTLVPEQEQRDVYGRTLADVRIGGGPLAGRDLGMALAQAGMARLLRIPPNIDHASRLRTAAAAARDARRGLWRACEGTGAPLDSPRQR